MNNKVTPFIGFDKEFEESELVLFGAPFDGTTSFRPGTRFGPTHMRNDSYGLETYSPYIDMDLEDYNLFDYGDLELPFGNTIKALNMIEDLSDFISSHNKKPLMIGGEHLVTLPNIKALTKKYKDIHVIHFDAHTDLRHNYMGEKLSHATVIKRVWDIIGDNRIFQFGIRSGLKEEFSWASKHTNLNKFNLNNLKETVEILKDKPVYVTIDLDVLDPSVFCGTGTIEPGGVTFKELLEAIYDLRHLNIVGADVVELSPHYDQSGMSTAVACKVLRELTLSILYQ